MRSKALFALCATLFIFFIPPVLAETTGFECTGPNGPQYLNPDHGLHTADLIDVKGKVIGVVDVYNTQDEMKFILKPTGDEYIKEFWLWTDSDISAIPRKNDGDPDLKKFPFQKTPKGLQKGEEYELSLNLLDQLNFQWKGESHKWWYLLAGKTGTKEFMAKGPCDVLDTKKGRFTFNPKWIHHPDRGHFIDSTVVGIGYHGPTQKGFTQPGGPDGGGGFLFFPGESIDFSVGTVSLGSAPAAKRVSPLDIFSGADINDPAVVGVAQTLQTLDEDSGALDRDGKIVLTPDAVGCFEAASGGSVNWTSTDENFLADLEEILVQAVTDCNATKSTTLAVVDADEAQGNLEAGLNASGIFRKNISKTEDWGETKQKLEVMPVYFPGQRSNGDPSLCVDTDGDKIFDELDGDTVGVPYEEWRLGGDPTADECDPRLSEDPEACQVTLIECRELAKPLLVTYMAKVDIYDEQVKEEFWPDRFSWDLFTAISRDDGTTWKRKNISRMADMSSFELKTTGEPFPGTVGSPYLKVNDNKILTVWQSKFCKSGNPRYSIDLCDDPDTEEVEADDPLTEENECAVYCRGNPDNDT